MTTIADAHMAAFELQQAAAVAVDGFRRLNEYFTAKEPWKLKGDEHAETRQRVVRYSTQRNQLDCQTTIPPVFWYYLERTAMGVQLPSPVKTGGLRCHPPISFFSRVGSKGSALFCADMRKYIPMGGGFIRIRVQDGTRRSLRLRALARTVHASDRRGLVCKARHTQDGNQVVVDRV